MRRIFVIALLLLSASYLFATELTLTSETSINAQIEADRAGGSPADVYIAESGAFYFWDATLQVDFDLHIKGTSSDWIRDQAAPPMFVPIPDGAGEIFVFVHITEGGSYKVENILFSGRNSAEGGDIIGGFLTEVGASQVIVDNCCFADFQNSIMEISGAPDLVSITNCIMINGSRTSSSPWGGHLGRFNTPGAELIIENNTYVNSGRILGNGGNFYTSNLTENHNSWINSQTNAQELHWKQALMANNIFYNWSWLGRKPSDVSYNYSITTFETYSGLALDSVSVYFGRNLLYRDPAIKEYYDTVVADSADVSPYICWNLDVDTTITEDDNFTIGKSYWDIDPEFTVGPGNLDKMLEWLYFKYVDNSGGWPDWRVTSPITYDADGQPVVSWPPAFDLSYSNEYMLVGATDGLPMGDLNWFPTAKATYLANRDSYIASLVDSITNATCLYIPGDSLSNRITADMLVSVDDRDLAAADNFDLAQNFPNPFNPTTTISFKLAKAQEISMKVYDVTGKLVTTLIDNKVQTAGSHIVTIDMADYSSGVYFTVLNAGSQKLVRKMTLLK